MSTILGIDKAASVDGWMSMAELQFLGEQARQSRRVLQVGCYLGRSSVVLAENVREKLIDVDLFVGDFGTTLSSDELVAQYRRNVGDLLGRKIDLRVGDSQKVLPTLEAGFDFVFIDGSHRYADVRRDVLAAIPLVAPGGVLAGHDYAHSEEVRRAVDEVLQGRAQLVPGTSIWTLRNDGTLGRWREEARARTAQLFAAAGGRRLHLGCGEKILAGYVNVDLYGPKADLKLDVADLTLFDDDSVDEIYMNAVFEHLFANQHAPALAEWRRVLRPGGVLRIESTPDFDAVVQAYVAGAAGNTRPRFDLDEVVRYTHGEIWSNEVGDLHKDIFTRAKMKRLLEAAGFEIERLESTRWGNEPHAVNIDVTGKKPLEAGRAHPVAVTTAAAPRAPTFGAVYCVYDDDSWLGDSFASVYDACTSVLFLVGDEPWHGRPTSNTRTLEVIAQLPDQARKVRVIRGAWATETEQRNAGLEILREAGVDYCFVVDADEIYDEAALARMMRFAAGHPEVACWHMTWDTYWKSHEWVIEPREPFKPVVFVKVGAARFIEHRNVGGEAHALVPPDVGFCHHMSYARTDEQVLKKITTFSHADEIRGGWFEKVWKGWDQDHALRDLHPTHPPAYGCAAARSADALPPVLRRRLARADDQAARQAARVPGLTSIVILTINELEVTKACVASIERHTPEPHELVFVDNGSSDGTVAWLRELARRHPACTVIENALNLGFAKGCNQGIAVARGEYVLLLNNDVVVTAGWLAGLRECLDSRPDAGFVGPMTNSISGPQKVPEVGYHDPGPELDAWAAEFRERNRHRRIPLRRIVGFCMLFRHALADTVGVLDERFGTGNFEDDDYCLRAALLGHTNLVAGDVFIHHWGSRSFRANRIDFGAAMQGNAWRFNEKWNVVDVGSRLGGRIVSLTAGERARELFARGKTDEAIAAVLEGVRRSPDDRELYRVVIEMLLETGAFAQGLELAQSLGANDPAARLLAGYCHAGLKHYDEAEAIARGSLALCETNARAMNLAGVVAFARGDRDRAATWFERACETDPSYGEPCTNLGVLAWAEGRRDEAFDALERGFVLAPQIADQAKSYYDAVLALGAWERAERPLLEALALHPLDRRLTMLLVGCLTQRGKLAQALEILEGAQAFAGDDAALTQAALDLRERLGPRGGATRDAAVVASGSR